MKTNPLFDLLTALLATGEGHALDTYLAQSSATQATQALSWACEHDAADLVPHLRPHLTMPWPAARVAVVTQAIVQGHDRVVAALLGPTPIGALPIHWPPALRVGWLTAAIAAHRPAVVQALIESVPPRYANDQGDFLAQGLAQAVAHSEVAMAQQMWDRLESEPREDALVSDALPLDDAQMAALVRALNPSASPAIIAWVAKHTVPVPDQQLGLVFRGESDLAWLEGLHGDRPGFPSPQHVLAAFPAERLNPLLQAFHQLNGWKGVDALLPHVPQELQEAWMASKGAKLPRTQAAKLARSRSAALAARPAASPRPRHRS